MKNLLAILFLTVSLNSFSQQLTIEINEQSNLNTTDSLFNTMYKVVYIETVNQITIKDIDGEILLELYGNIKIDTLKRMYYDFNRFICSRN
jgi:hypothetical protein